MSFKSVVKAYLVLMQICYYCMNIHSVVVNVLSTVLLLLTVYHVIVGQILSRAVAKGQLSQPVQSRLVCCMILGKAATKFEPFV